MDLALYDPTCGYYTTDRPRVGQDRATDFYTASSLGPIFGELVTAVVRTQLGSRNPADYTFIELGAEDGRSVLDDVAHPFRALKRVGIHDALTLSGPCVVFSNELFDAQPCARFIRADDGWLERGVMLDDGQVKEVSRPAAATIALPAAAATGYQLDWPFRAAALAKEIADHPWHGLFVAFDYGKSARELTQECPHGTVRAYHRHRQVTDVLASPGAQDLTCHICWDDLSAALHNAGFKVDPVLSQEAFFVKNAARALAEIMQSEAHGLSARKSGLMQLLHPSALGQKFQALTAWRDVC